MTIEFKNHLQYESTIDACKLVRDAIEGETKIKSERTLYLKHPNMLDDSSPNEQRRYEAYLHNAEYDGYPANTEGSMIGKMTEGQTVYDLPEQISYLENNADGDGMSLDGIVEILYKNILEVKFHVLVAEYSSFASIDTASISLADKKRMNPRASIKSYSRESLTDWDFTRINGVMQLSLLVLSEESTERNPETLVVTTIKSKLILALDENGDYYQQKIILSSDGRVISGDDDRDYPQVDKKNLKWIPAQVIVDEKTQPGIVPAGMGFLYPICAASIARYGVNADYKEALHFFGPTLFNSGWKDGDYEMFKTINGREYIAFGIGVANNLPEGVKAEIIGSGIQLEPFEKYFEINERGQRIRGASVDDGSATKEKTATQSAIENSQRTAIYQRIVNNVESGLRQIISYCAMYEGLWSQDAIEENLDKIIVTLPRDFSRSELSPEAQGAIRENYMAGLISRDEAVKLLVQGGATVSSAEDIINEVDSQGPLPAQSGNNSLNVQ